MRVELISRKAELTYVFRKDINVKKKETRAESQNYIYKDIVYCKNVCTQYNREGKKKNIDMENVIHTYI